MTRYLIDQGHRSILHFSGNRGLLGAERRISGYVRALEDAGIAFADDLLMEAGFSFDCGRRAMAEWLRQHGKPALPDAIFCASDAIAVGVLETLAENAIRVPEEVSLAGFDNTLLRARPFRN